jgi:hypothetical protein
MRCCIPFQLKPVRSLDSLRSAWNGRLQHGPPPSSISYEHYHLPKHFISEVVVPKDFYSQTPPTAPPLPSHILSSIESQSNEQNNINSNFREMRSSTNSKLQMIKAPLIELSSVQVNSDSNQIKSFNVCYEFANPINLSVKYENFNFKSFGNTSEINNESMMLQHKESEKNDDKLRTEDPFEIYSNPSILQNIYSHQNLSDPFDTSQTINPFNFPDPLFHIDDHRLPIDSPSILKNIDYCSTYAKVNVTTYFLYFKAQFAIGHFFLCYFLLCYCTYLSINIFMINFLYFCIFVFLHMKILFYELTIIKYLLFIINSMIFKFFTLFIRVCIILK